MSANLDNGENFLAAHSHHEQAASFNREASRHFEAGKDYAHASHQAWTAHGHALQARDLASEIVLHYGKHVVSGKTPDSQVPPKFEVASGSFGGNGPSVLNCAAHLATAADHHDQAARRLADASRHFAAKDYVPALRAAHSAIALGVLALSHSEEAAKCHVKESGAVSAATHVL